VREGGDSRHATVCGMGRELAHKAKDANSSMSPSGLPHIPGVYIGLHSNRCDGPITPNSGRTQKDPCNACDPWETYKPPSRADGPKVHSQAKRSATLGL